MSCLQTIFLAGFLGTNVSFFFCPYLQFCNLVASGFQSRVKRVSERHEN
jgi:uncharacterized membrane protein YwzB